MLHFFFAGKATGVESWQSYDDPRSMSGAKASSKKTA